MLLRALDSLARRVELERKEWRSTNQVRKDFAYPHVQAAILDAAENPSRHVPNWLALTLLLSGLSWGLAYQFDVRATDPYKSAEIISYLAALWAVQAAVVALVYPIVIGFVALLFQGRQNAKAILYIYLHDTAALLAGLSSLALIALMAVHHLVMYRASPGVVLAWSALDSVWFLINMSLTAFFLIRTFEFLLPDKRAHIIQRYAVNVAWPNELRVHLSEAFFASAVLSKWLPGTAFGEKDKEAEPKILLGAAGHGMGREALSVPVGRNVGLVDVWFRPLRWAIQSWLKRAEAKRPEVPGEEHEAAVLIFPATPEATYSDKAILCRVVGDVPLSRLEQWLIGASFRFGRLGKGQFDLSVIAILADMEADARNGIAGDNLVAYEEKVDELRDLYALLVRASICKDTEGRDENYTRVSDSAHWFGNSVFKSWSRTFLNLFEPAARALDVGVDFVPKLAYVPVHLFSKLLERGHEDILIHMIRLLPILQRRTGDWWQRTLQRQGVTEHGPCVRQVLRPPQQLTYESLLVHLVGAWSSLKNERFPPHRSETPTWDELRKCTPYFEAHLSETLQMLLGSVFRGDQASAEWWCDVLHKWWDQLQYRFDRGTLFMRRERFINIELAKKTWEEVQSEVDIQAFRASAQAPRGVFAACIRNLWIDACCLAMYVLAVWGRTCDCERSLAGHILDALMKGKHFKEGGTLAGDHRPISGPSDLLVAFLRQNYAASSFMQGYRATLDKWVEDIAHMTDKEWVSGWVYGGWGRNDLDSLRGGQITVLSFLVTAGWDPIRQIDEVLRRWVREDEGKLRDLRHDMEEWANQLGGGNMSEYRRMFDCYNRQSDPKPEFDNALKLISGAIDAIAKRVEEIRGEALRDAPVAEERLREIERWASKTAFDKESADFPVSMFGHVQATEVQGERRGLILQRRDKGEYTHPVMAQLPVNEEEWFAETMNSQVAGFVMGQIIRQLHVEAADGSTADRYWAEVKRFRDRTVASGHQPLLLVENPTIPDWIWEWSLTEWDKNREPPYGLALTRNAEFNGKEGYLGNFGDVAVFDARLPPGNSYLIALDAFEKIEFTQHGQGFVQATWQPVEGEGRLIDVTLSWHFKLHLRDLPTVKLTYPRKTGESPEQ